MQTTVLADRESDASCDRSDMLEGIFPESEYCGSSTAATLQPFVAMAHVTPVRDNWPYKHTPLKVV